MEGEVRERCVERKPEGPFDLERTAYINSAGVIECRLNFFCPEWLDALSDEDYKTVILNSMNRAHSAFVDKLMEAFEKYLERRNIEESGQMDIFNA